MDPELPSKQTDRHFRFLKALVGRFNKFSDHAVSPRFRVAFAGKSENFRKNGNRMPLRIRSPLLQELFDFLKQPDRTLSRRTGALRISICLHKRFCAGTVERDPVITPAPARIDGPMNMIFSGKMIHHFSRTDPLNPLSENKLTDPLHTPEQLNENLPFSRSLFLPPGIRFIVSDGPNMHRKRKIRKIQIRSRDYFPHNPVSQKSGTMRNALFLVKDFVLVAVQRRDAGRAKHETKQNKTNQIQPESRIISQQEQMKKAFLPLFPPVRWKYTL